MLDCIVDIQQGAIDPLSNVFIKGQGRRVFVPVPQSIQQTIDLSNRGIIVNWRCQSWCPSAGSVGTLARTVSPLFAVKQLIPNSTASGRPRTRRFNGKLNYCAFMAIYNKPTQTATTQKGQNSKTRLKKAPDELRVISSAHVHSPVGGRNGP